MVKKIGKYNLEYRGLVYEGDFPYEILAITEFKDNVEVGTKIYYIRKGYDFYMPKLYNTGEIERMLRLPNHTKLAYEMVERVLS